MLKHTLTTLAVAAVSLISYNGHAGLGANAITDGTSNTITVGERAAGPKGFSIDIGTSENVAGSGLILMADSGGQFHAA